MLSGRSELKLRVQYRLKVRLEEISYAIGTVRTVRLLEDHTAVYRLSHIRKALRAANAIKILRDFSRP